MTLRKMPGAQTELKVELLLFKWLQRPSESTRGLCGNQIKPLQTSG